MYCWENKVLQLAKAVVNSRPSLPFQQMFDRLFWLKIKQEQFRVLYSIFVLNKVKTGVLKRNFRLNYLRSTSFSNVIRHHFSLCELDHVQNGGSKPRSLSQSIRPHVFTKWQANNLSLKVSWSKTKRRAHFYDIIKGPSWGNTRAKNRNWPMSIKLAHGRLHLLHAKSSCHDSPLRRRSNQELAWDSLTIALRCLLVQTKDRCKIFAILPKARVFNWLVFSFHSSFQIIFNLSGPWACGSKFTPTL